jgi:hypothetical protein
MNHYIAAGLWALAAILIPILWVAVGLPFNRDRSGGWWW